MRGVTICGCDVCGWRGFPHRFWCPSCGSFETRDVVVEVGVAEQVTTVWRAAGRPQGSPTMLGTVRVEGDAQIIARLESIEAGDDVRLDTEGGAFVGRHMQHAKCKDVVSE